MSETDESEFRAELEAAFVEAFGADEETAAAAAEKAAAFRAEYDESLTVSALTDRLDDGYESFAHRFDYAVGDLAAAAEDCTDSREFRLAGFGDLAADPEQGG
jgi:hypothetical protein